MTAHPWNGDTINVLIQAATVVLLALIALGGFWLYLRSETDKDRIKRFYELERKRVEAEKAAAE